MEYVKKHVDRVKRKTRSFDKDREHSPQLAHHDQSDSRSLPGSSSDKQATPNNTEVSNHDGISNHDEQPDDASATALPAFPRPVVHMGAASLAPPKHKSTRDDFEPALALRNVRSSTLRSRSPYEKLRDNVTNHMSKNEIGFLTTSNYLPETVQQELVTDQKIREVFQGISENLVIYITTKAPRTFLITLLTIVSADKGLDAMEAFQYHSFTDEDCLPVERMTSPKYPADTPTCIRDWNSDQWGCETCPPDEEDVYHPRDKSCTHIPELSAFHHSCWDLTSFNEFYKKQWQFSLQKFSVRDFEYEEIEDDRILPFQVDEESPEKAGNFSEVKQAWMLASHLLQPSDPESKSADPSTLSPLVPCPSHDRFGRVKVAIKTLKALSQPHYHIGSEWKREADAYKALNSLNHKHIVKGLAAFRQRSRYHLLLEWANGGSLQTFWNKKPRRTLTRDNVKELLEQLHGLADALYNMHNTKIARSRRTSSRSRDSPMGSQTKVKDFVDGPANEQSRVHFAKETEIVPAASQIPSYRGDSNASAPPTLVPTILVDHFGDVNRDENAIDDTIPDDPQIENWRHGDIKPDNILRFITDSESENESNSKLGILKLADLGRAKRHMNVTIERGDIEIDKWHTKKYEPPDIFIHGEGRTTSRLYDIWSLGCVFFEAVVWILYGHTEVTNFELTTTKRETEGTPYWTRSGDDAVVTQMAGLWMSSILRDDPECRGPKSSALADLMRLIQRKMLVVQLPQRSDEPTSGCRTNAKDVLDEMTVILGKAKNDEEYLFTGKTRKGVKPPPSGKRANDQLSVVPSQGAALASGSKSQGSNLGLPRATVASPTALRRQSQYTHALSDAWSYQDDDVFVKATWNRVLAEEPGVDIELLPKTVSKLCQSCSAFDPSVAGSFRSRLMKELNVGARKCRLCKLLLNRANEANIAMTATINVERQGGKLRINGKDSTALRICRSPDTPAVYKERNSHIPIGIPKLPDAEGKTRIGIIREWLNDCDKHGCVPTSIRMYCPRRLLFIGKESGEQCCRLIETAKLGHERHNVQYVALSHPWGDPVSHVHFKSTKQNLAEHMIGIDESDLPQNFTDAISVTRQLDISYLWIDIICISQASGDDEGDFLDEAEHMQDIFSTAYCVIAASSATGMSYGFLNVRDNPDVVVLPPKKTGTENPAQFYISKIVDDFERDVEQSPLNQRGWVLQERALARRTIYFTENQTYWECGQGIRCETLSKLKSDEAAFLGDPEFPQFGTKGQPMGAQLFLFTGLYEQYSRLGFTHKSDKPVAIAGLELSLTKKFADRSGAGIFATHKSRWLLWERANTVDTLERIEFSKSTVRAPPSWSWMSYIGGITFLEPPKGQTTWNTDIELILTGDGNTSWLYAKEQLAMNSSILTVDDVAAGEISTSLSTPSNSSQRAEREISLVFDIPSLVAGLHKQYVIIGTFGNRTDTNSRTYVLVVTPAKHHANPNTYERIGAGWLPNRMVKTGAISPTQYSIV